MSTTAVRETVAAPSANRGSTTSRRTRSRLPVAVVVALLAGAAAAAWSPFVAGPLSSDEGGFLLVASQWSPGTSLYGDYWVDRPPLLIGLFGLADLGGGAVALRLLGILAVVASVFLAAGIGRLVAPRTRTAPVLADATAAVFLSTPLFGTTEVDGELLGVPFVLAGLIAVLRGSAARDGRWSTAWWLAAGLLATAAAAVKQGILEVFVAAAVAVGWLLWTRQPGRAVRASVGFALGCAAATAALLWWAAAHGTYPAALWDAVVSFRAEADAVISASAPSSTDRRGVVLALAFLASGAAAVLVAALAPSRRRRERLGSAPLAGGGCDVRLLAGGVLAWEHAVVAGGGSYWLHYLLGTVPGLVLVVTAAVCHRPWRRRWIAVSLGYAALVAVVAVVALAAGARGGRTDLQVERYLVEHAQPGDTGVTAFGDPAILQAAHLRSPYPQLWSLPVRVRDPRLGRFTRVLAGPERPTWVIVSGGSLGTWGVDPRSAEPVLTHRYHLVHVVGDWHLYHLDPGRSRA